MNKTQKLNRLLSNNTSEKSTGEEPVESLVDLLSSYHVTSGLELLNGYVKDADSMANKGLSQERVEEILRSIKSDVDLVIGKLPLSESESPTPGLEKLTDTIASSELDIQVLTDMVKNAAEFEQNGLSRADVFEKAENAHQAASTIAKDFGDLLDTLS